MVTAHPMAPSIYRVEDPILLVIMVDPTCIPRGRTSRTAHDMDDRALRRQTGRRRASGSVGWSSRPERRSLPRQSDRQRPTSSGGSRRPSARRSGCVERLAAMDAHQDGDEK